MPDLASTYHLSHGQKLHRVGQPYDAEKTQACPHAHEDTKAIGSNQASQQAEPVGTSVLGAAVDRDKGGKRTDKTPLP